MIWTRCPKRVYFKSSVFKTAVETAGVGYNDGAQRLPPVFNKLGIENGYFVKKGSRKSDMQRVKHKLRKSRLAQ